MWKKKLVIYLVVLSLCSQSVFATGSINPSIETDSQFEHKIEIPFLQNISAGSVEDQGKSNTCMIEVLADKVENAAAIAKSEADLIVGNHRPKRTCSHYVDAKFLLSVIDPKEILCPVTPRKVAYWTGYGALIAGLAVLEQHYPYMNTIKNGIVEHAAVAAFFIIGFEFSLTVLLLSVSKYPEKHPTRQVTENDEWRGPEDELDQSNSSATALVIPCHNSERLIEKTLHAALKHFKGEQIYIIDNGRTEEPADNTREVVHAIDPNVHYIWSSVGNKTKAQYIGAVAAKDYKYILTTDDDVAIPENFVNPWARLNDDVKAVCFPIESVDAEGKKPLLVAWQDIEYKLAAFGKIAQDNVCGVLYPHGACSFWDRETFIKALRLVDCSYYSEDAKLGMALMKMGKKLGFDAGTTFQTESPSTLLGPPLNYYIQRVRSWELGRQVLYDKYLEHLFSMNGQKTVAGFSYQKAIEIYTIYANLSDVVRVPMMIPLAGTPLFWYVFTGVTSVGPVIPLMIWKYAKLNKRPDLDVSSTAILSYPAYKLLHQVISTMAVIRAITVYWPNFKKPITISEMEANNDPKCIWLNNQEEDAQPVNLPINLEEARE